MRAIGRLIVLLVLAPLLGAQVPPPSVDPPFPTSATPVTATVWEYDTCPPPPVITRDRQRITITLGAGPCLSPVVLIRHDLSLGLLAPGDYELIVTDDGERTGFLSFFVRDAAKTLFIFPSLGTSGSTVTIHTTLVTCTNAGCTPPPVTFDGIPATGVVAVDSLTIRLRVPPHAPGAVEVVVGGSQDAQRERAAFTYYDPNDPPPASLFTRVLFPVVFDGPGAHGSRWTTEISARNASSFDVTPWRGDVFPAGTPIRLTFPSPHPNGVILFVPRESAGSMYFNTLVRDISRQSGDWGAEIPVVREHEFASGRSVELLNVPLQPEFRQTLRIYGLDSVDDVVSVTIRSMTTGAVLAERLVPLEGGKQCLRFLPCASEEPTFAILGDFVREFPQVAGTERVAVRVEPRSEQPVWAFVTITNNATQHVTVIAPQ